MSAPPRTTDPASLAWLFYTSGTTGRSKGAMLSHRNLMAMTVSHLADFDSPDENSSLIHGAPMSHGSGLYVPPYVSRGARQVVPASGAFEPLEFLDLCEHHPGCSAFLAPTMVARLVQTGRARPRNLTTIVYGGGPMYVDSLKKAMTAFGPIFVQLYGQGEAPMTITGLRRADHVDADDAVLGSVGYARSGVDVAVLGPDGAPAGIDDIGEIVVPRRCGDVGLLEQSRRDRGDTAGRLVAHRRHGVVRRPGFPHAARPVQRRGDQRGQQHLPPRGRRGPARTPRRCRGRGRRRARRRVGRGGGRVHRRARLPRDLDAHLLERIARFKRPKRYEFVDELPKNSYGKVLKRDLRGPGWCDGGSGGVILVPGSIDVVATGGHVARVGLRAPSSEHRAPGSGEGPVRSMAL